MHPNEATPMQPDPVPPHAWCDNRCRRCPIRDCPVRSGGTRQDWGEQLRLEAPDATGLRLEDLLRDFRNVTNAGRRPEDRESRGAREIAAAADPAPDARHLSDIVCRLFAAVQDAVNGPGEVRRRHVGTAIDEVLALASLLRIKAASLAACPDEPQDARRQAETLPTLLLLHKTAENLERPLQALRDVVSAETSARLDACHGELRRAILARLTDAAAAQELLDRLIGQRRAPSPFCTV